MLDSLHESMDRTLQQLAELPIAERSRAGETLLAAIERDLAVERRLLAELGIAVPGLSGVGPLATLQQNELDRLLARLKAPNDTDERRWTAALAELRVQLDAAFVAVDLALSDRA